MTDEHLMTVSEVIGAPGPLLTFPPVRPALLLLGDNAIVLKKPESEQSAATIAELRINEIATVKARRNALRRNREALFRVMQWAPVITIVFMVVRTFRRGSVMSYSQGDVLALITQAAIVGLVLSIGLLFVSLKRLPNFAYSVVYFRSATSKFTVIVMSDAQVDRVKAWCDEHKVRWS